jgi:3-hydroxymyristoyl/3-hydroxydecanoyl-(acyl carrier protein) dehydratase
MNGHFRAFSFVDRITSLREAGRVEGCYVIPDGLTDFPPCLAAEAVGQLAAWAAMKAADFARRPVAGLAGRVDLLGNARPGQLLELSVDIESLDEEAISYRGSAAIDGAPVIRLHDCVGPMIPVVELDAPDALRDRFDLLCGKGIAAGGFPGLPPLLCRRIGGDHGASLRAAFAVPLAAPFFADHFPRRPVFPGSLLMQACLQIASDLLAEITPPAAGNWTLQSVVNMKLREFIPPGKALVLEARIKQPVGDDVRSRVPGGKDLAPDSLTLLVDARAGDEIVGSARLLAGTGNSK